MIAVAAITDDRTYTELRGAAIHEAGHAVLAVLFRCRLQHATIVPTATDWGHVRCFPPLDPVRRIALLVAGFVAEMRFGLRTLRIEDTSTDMQSVADTLASLYPDGTPDKTNEFHQGATLAVKLVRENRKAIARIADRLLVRNTLSGQAVQRLMQTKGKRHASH